ncbi:MAG: outer membrane beta-barrel protein, partial [Clostridium sp.]|nr:outer membrane beta-barrel protein [Clostridium sp.]
MKKYLSSFLLLLLAALYAAAFNIDGTVVDSAGEPLPRAAVRILTVKDSVLVKGAIANDDGAFKLEGVKKGQYLLEASYVGFAPLINPIKVDKDQKMGRIVLSENAAMLKDVTVTGIRTPIRVAQDTVEFNADSYKTQPNAVVEDLLKRLPGVEVDSDGKITHNGREIKKILVEGKEFFGDDPTVASKNVPVDMIEKLQVVDRKSDLARMTGVDDGEDEVVINLEVKPGMETGGWFGNVEAGYGTDERYKASVFAQRFWGDGNQLTILGGMNNVNDLGFRDGGSGRFRRFGGSNGITTSKSLGVNFNIGNGEIFRLGGDIMYSNSKRDTRTKQNRQYLFADSTSFYDSQRNTLDKGDNFSANFRLQWKPDSFNTLEFRPTMSLNFSDSKSDDESNTYAGHRNSDVVGDQVNRNTNKQLSHGDSYEFGGRLIFNHNFKQRRGRSFSVFVNYRFSNVKEKANTFSEIMYYLLNKDSIYDQYENNRTWSNQISSRISWTEPIGNVRNGNFVTLAYNISYRWNNADRITYGRPSDLPQDQLFSLDPLPVDVPIDSLSNRFRNNYMNQDIRLGFRHVSKTQNIDVGFSFVPQMSKSIDLINSAKNIPERWVWNYAPYLRYRWKMSQTRSMNIDYNGRSSQPSMEQLQPVADVSDPLNIVQGNPNLDPSFNHNLQFRFQDFNPQAQRAIMVMVNASMTQNAIISRTDFNQETGGRFTTYENVNGIWNVNGFTMLSFPLRNKAFTINNHLGGGYSHSVGFSNGLKNKSGSLRLNESFGIAWRPDNLELELRPQYSLQYTTNSVQKNNNRTVHGYGGRFSGTYYTPFGLVLSTDLNYTANRGYGEGYNTNEWMWNASISYQMLKGKNLILTISGYDLLQQRSNISRQVTAQYIQDAMYNSLTRYFMATVSYKFNTFKGKRRQEGPGEGFGGPGGP